MPHTHEDVRWREGRVEPRDKGLEGEMGALKEEDAGWTVKADFLGSWTVEH